MLIMSISGFKDCLPLRQQAQQSHIHSPLMPGLFLLRIILLFFNVMEEFGSGYLLRYMFFCHVACLCFFFCRIHSSQASRESSLGQKESHQSKSRTFWKLLRSFCWHATSRSAVHGTTKDLCSSHHTHRASSFLYPADGEKPHADPIFISEMWGMSRSYDTGHQ